MGSDMERLCEAVEVVCDHHGMMACDTDHKAIVRAVLTGIGNIGLMSDPSGRTPHGKIGLIGPSRA